MYTRPPKLEYRVRVFFIQEGVTNLRTKQRQTYEKRVWSQTCTANFGAKVRRALPQKAEGEPPCKRESRTR